MLSEPREWATSRVEVSEAGSMQISRLTSKDLEEFVYHLYRFKVAPRILFRQGSEKLKYKFAVSRTFGAQKLLQLQIKTL